MFAFTIILRNLKDKFIEPWKYAIPFLPMACIYIFLLRPAMNASAVFSNFVWLADCLVFGYPIGFCVAFFVGGKVGGTWGDAVFYPKRYLKTAPDILSPIKGMVTQGKYDEAIEELNELLEDKPFSPEPYLILVEIYGNELGDHRRVMELTEAYFGQKKIYAFDENIEMLLLYADICAEHSCLEKARLLLRQEVARKGYSAEKRGRLQTRLDAIEES